MVFLRHSILRGEHHVGDDVCVHNPDGDGTLWSDDEWLEFIRQEGIWTYCAMWFDS